MPLQIPTSDGPLDAPERVLVVVAHPDDIDFGSAGTIATLTNAGTYVAYCLATSGEAGEDDMTVSSEDLAAMREAEQAAAAELVGVSEIHWLHHPDGRVVADLGLRRDISRVIRIVKPDVVISQNPEPSWDRIYGSHPDHLATATATMAAVYPDSRNPRAHPELLEECHAPHVVTEVWMGSQEPTRYIDITPVFEKKVEALRAHVSQTARMGDRLPELLREWSSQTAEKAGMPEGSLAEGFRVINAS
ncbi:MAG: PIG-L family deacetylase [Actinomycetota bacterium]|nr:PIG-L family deacetylase [Actinomycetota bacterium]